jgi:predicted nucleic acid-binding protein
MPTLILDTDFLSSFLKIGRCDLVRTLYQAEQAIIPAAVHRELAQTDLLTQLLAISWIDVSLEDPVPDETLLQDPGFHALGAGEQACILLARNVPDAVLLISDNVARRFARSLGVTVVNIGAATRQPPGQNGGTTKPIHEGHQEREEETSVSFVFLVDQALCGSTCDNQQARVGFLLFTHTLAVRQPTAKVGIDLSFVSPSPRPDR